MTVRELIEQLKAIPQDRQNQEVVVHEGEFQSGEANPSSSQRLQINGTVASLVDPLVLILAKPAGASNA